MITEESIIVAIYLHALVFNFEMFFFTLENWCLLLVAAGVKKISKEFF